MATAVAGPRVRRGAVLRGRPLLLMTGRFVDEPAARRRHRAQGRVLPARREAPRHLSHDVRLHLPLRPGLVLERAETGFYNLFRRYAPEQWRNSAFYTKYVATKNKLLGSIGIRDGRTEPLIQDWEVPWQPRRRADPLRDRQRRSRRPAVGRRADQAAAPADALPDQAERALLQPRLLLPGAAARRQRRRITTRRSWTASASSSAASRCSTPRRS